jgi:hypothetical protein
VSSINWKDLKKSADDATKPAPDGEYDLEVVKAEAGTAATSGNPKINAQLRVDGGPSHGKTMFHTFNLTPDSAIALSFFFAAMEAFGLDGNFFDQEPSMEQIAAALVGRKVHAKIGHREWNGQTRNNIETFSMASGGPGAGSFGVPTVGVPGVPTGVSAASTPGVPGVLTGLTASTIDMPKSNITPPLPF